MPQVNILAGDGVRIEKSGFGFSAMPVEKMEASEYTIVTIALDVSGSTESFIDSLRKFPGIVLDALKKDPRANNMLVRVLAFDSDITEVHGFLEPDRIDKTVYESINSGGATALYDTTYAAFEATKSIADTLVASHRDCNAAVYIVTDGLDNESNSSISDIKKLISNIIRSEKIESVVSFLIGLNNASLTGANHGDSVEAALNSFKDQVGITHFINYNDVSADTIAKIAYNVSKSISSQSMSQGTGGPSTYVF